MRPRSPFKAQVPCGVVLAITRFLDKLYLIGGTGVLFTRCCLLVVTVCFHYMFHMIRLGPAANFRNEARHKPTRLRAYIRLVVPRVISRSVHTGHRKSKRMIHNGILPTCGRWC